MRTAELREMSGEDLVVHLAEAREELFNLRFQNATGRLDNYKRLQSLRREVARIETIIREAELGITREVSEEAEQVERPRRRLFRKNPVEETKSAKDESDDDDQSEDESEPAEAEAEAEAEADVDADDEKDDEDQE